MTRIERAKLSNGQIITIVVLFLFVALSCTGSGSNTGTTTVTGPPQSIATEPPFSSSPVATTVISPTQVAHPTSTAQSSVFEPIDVHRKVVVATTPGNPRMDAIAFDGGGFPAFVDSGVGNEGLFWGGETGDRMTPMLATGWELQPNGTTVTINIRKGVPWYAPVGWEHIDFGMFTANDFADWMNLSNPTTNPETKHYLGGWWAPHYGEARAIDSHTLEIDLLQTISFELPGLSIFDCFCAGPDFVRGVEMMGSEWANKYPVRTSPFTWETCDLSIGDLSCSAHAVENHWRKTPNISELEYVGAEFEVAISMMQIGAADMMRHPYVWFEEPSSLPDGLRFLNFGSYTPQSIAWSGNLWEEFHAATGTPLDPWDSPVYDIDRPWIGDPWQESHPEKVRYDDIDNPSGMTDMEQARIVRLAMSSAIDRKSLIDVSQKGVGVPLYTEYIGPFYPGWDPERTSGVWTLDGNQIEESEFQWTVPWVTPDGDLAEADRLLTLAGYPLVEGIRQGFNEPIFLYPGNNPGMNIPASQFIMSVWLDLGIPVADIGGPGWDEYRDVIADRNRLRENYFPVMKNGDVEHSRQALDLPFSGFDNSRSRAKEPGGRGAGIGFDSPYLAEQVERIANEPDKSIRVSERFNTINYMYFWQLYSGMYQTPNGLVVTDRIASWGEPYTAGLNGWNGHPEYIVLSE